MKKFRKKILIGTTVGLACLVLGACTNDTDNSSAEISSASADSTVSEASSAVSEISISESTSDAADSATSEVSYEASEEASITQTDTPITTPRETAGDSATVDVSMGDHFDDPPVTNLPDPTVEVR